MERRECFGFVRVIGWAGGRRWAHLVPVGYLVMTLRTMQMIMKVDDEGDAHDWNKVDENLDLGGSGW